jgi:hypothetical protein
MQPSEPTFLAVTTTDPNAIDLLVFKGRMSEAERNRMMRAGLCFWCKENGHLSQDCPTKGKGKDASRISKLEAELQRLKGGTGKTGKTVKGDGSKNRPAQD